MRKDKPKTMRFATLQRDFGPVVKATSISEAEWKEARRELRYMTVYHPSGGPWDLPVLGVVAHDGCCDTVCKAVFAKPVPPWVKEITGMRHNIDAQRILG